MALGPLFLHILGVQVTVIVIVLWVYTTTKANKSGGGGGVMGFHARAGDGSSDTLNSLPQ